MSEKTKGFLVYLIMGAIVSVLVFALGYSREYSVLRSLCDGLFVAAVLLLGFGGLKYARNQGIFDMMGYSLKSVFQLHYPFTKMNSPLEEKNEDFVAYKERKRAARKPAGEILWAGLAYLAASVVVLVIYLLTA